MAVHMDDSVGDIDDVIEQVTIKQDEGEVRDAADVIVLEPGDDDLSATNTENTENEICAYGITELFMMRRKGKAIALLSIYCEVFDQSSSARTKSKRLWTKPWISRRQRQGYFDNLIRELSLEDHDSYRRMLRMDVATFELLVNLISPHIIKENTTMREAISSSQRLAITLRFLATGENYQSLSFQFRVGLSTISKLIPEVIRAIFEVLKVKYLHCPKDPEAWSKIAGQFRDMWNFPNCIGAMDGKHVMIQPPPSSGSYYYNYKGSNSIVMLAVVDADLRFVYVDAGTYGRASDGAVWNKSSQKEAIESTALGIPLPAPIPGWHEPMPYVFVGDEGFGLKSYLLRPYPARDLNDQTRVFNYRLSRARRVSENAFGILRSRFQIFGAPIRLHPSKVTDIILATCAVHNMLRCQSTTRANHTPEGSIDREDVISGTLIPGSWRDGLQPGGIRNLQPYGANTTNEAKQIRKRYCDYFNGAGAVSWQWDRYY